MATTRTTSPGKRDQALIKHLQRLEAPIGDRRVARIVALGSSLLPVCAMFSIAGPSAAAEWTVKPAIAVEETWTDNVNLAPSDLARSDFVTQITPSVGFSGVGAHAQLFGVISVPVLLYARTGAENNNVYPEVSVVGNAELVDKLFYLDGAISITQPFLSAFGAQPQSLTSGTDNRYTASAYRISPYLRGETADNVEFELRNNSIWSTTNNTPAVTSNAFTNEWVGHLASSRTRIGWFADLDFLDVKFSDQNSQRLNLVRAGPSYVYDAQLRLLASGGYEQNDFPYSSYNGATYGAGVEWRPSERTAVTGNVEHRFFGTSYLLKLDYRTPLSVWDISAFRNITNYPQQLSTPLSSTSINGLLNELFLSRIPDPKARQQAVDNYIEADALPSSLTGAVNYYSQQVLLTNNVTATAGFTGARNSLFLTVYYSHNEPISGSGNTLPGVLDSGNNNTQEGGNLVWTHRLAPFIDFNLTLYALRTEANSPQTGWTNQAAARAVLSRALTPHTTVFAGARYQILHSDVTTEYTEAAVFAGLKYTFK